MVCNSQLVAKDQCNLSQTNPRPPSSKGTAAIILLPCCSQALLMNRIGPSAGVILVTFEEGALEEAGVVFLGLHNAQAAVFQVQQDLAAPHPVVLLRAVIHALLEKSIEAQHLSMGQEAPSAGKSPHQATWLTNQCTACVVRRVAWPTSGKPSSVDAFHWRPCCCFS